MIDQNSQFMAILTAVGEAKQANADALGIPWTFSQMGVGDANGADPIPDRLQTQLIHEQRRAPLNQVKIDPKNSNVIIAEQVIPENEGGWWIREIGLYDEDSDLVAVANCAPSFKPLLAQGSGKTQVVRMNFIVTSADNVVLKIDPSVVLATRQYVDDRIIEVLPATRPAGTYQKVTIDERGIVTEGSNPNTLEGHGIVLPTQGESEAGENNTKPMTPLGVAQAIAKNALSFTPVQQGGGADQLDNKIHIGWSGSRVKVSVDGTDQGNFITDKNAATESTVGVLKVATQAQTNTGSDDASIITPKKLRFGFSSSFGSSGYIALPSWLGSFVVQWGNVVSHTINTDNPWSYPVAFPVAALVAIACPNNSGLLAYASISSSLSSKTSLSFRSSTTGNTFLIALGN